MILERTTSVAQILRYAGRVEDAHHAKAHRMDEQEARQILEYAQKARDLATLVHRPVTVLRRRAMPTIYRWSGAKVTVWVVAADPDCAYCHLSVDRVKVPANSRSFDGVELRVDGVQARRILWETGRQSQRVVRMDDESIRAVQMILALLLLVLMVSY